MPLTSGAVPTSVLFAKIELCRFTGFVVLARASPPATPVAVLFTIVQLSIVTTVVEVPLA